MIYLCFILLVFTQSVDCKLFLSPKVLFGNKNTATDKDAVCLIKKQRSVACINDVFTLGLNRTDYYEDVDVCMAVSAVGCIEEYANAENGCVSKS